MQRKRKSRSTPSVMSSAETVAHIPESSTPVDPLVLDTVDRAGVEYGLKPSAIRDE